MGQEMTNRETVHLFVEGRVQNVGFRYATQRKATELGLTGWVRNTKDGRIEIEASGASEPLERFLTWCGKGPDQAKVKGVYVVRRENSTGPSLPSFSIQR